MWFSVGRIIKGFMRASQRYIHVFRPLCRWKMLSLWHHQTATGSCPAPLFIFQRRHGLGEEEEPWNPISVCTSDAIGDCGWDCGLNLGRPWPSFKLWPPRDTSLQVLMLSHTQSSSLWRQLLDCTILFYFAGAGGFVLGLPARSTHVRGLTLYCACSLGLSCQARINCGSPF